MVWLVTAMAWACPEPSTSTDVQRNVEAALVAFVDLDDAAFANNRTKAIDAVRCLNELIHPAHAGSFMRLEGIFAFSRGNQEFAANAFRGAATVQPMHQLQTVLAPPGGPLHTLYQQALTVPASTWVLPQSNGLRFVNGVQTDLVPNSLAVVQVTDVQGGVRWTGILTSPADLPPDFASIAPPGAVPVAPPAPQPMPLPAPTPEPFVAPEPTGPPPPQPVPDVAPVPTEDPYAAASTKNPVKLPLLIAAGGIGAVAAGLYGGSIVTRTRYQRAPTAKRRALTNNLWVAGVGAAGVAVTVGVVGLALPSKKKSQGPSDDFEGGLY